MTKPELVSVVIVTFKREKEVYRCLESVYKSSHKNIEVVMVDNNKGATLAKSLKKSRKTFKYIIPGINTGAAGGRNIGLQNSKGKYILFLDDDSVVDRKMIENLIKVFKNKKDAGLVQPVIYDLNNKKNFQGAGHDINLVTGRIKPFGIDLFGKSERDENQYKGIRRVPMCGCIWMVKKELFEKIGKYDEEYFIPYEDSDLSIRATKAGFSNYCSSESVAHHPVDKKLNIHPILNFLGLFSEERAYRASRNKLIFMKKHSTFPKNIIFYFVYFPFIATINSFAMLITKNFSMFASYYKGIISGLLYVFKK